MFVNAVPGEPMVSLHLSVSNSLSVLTVLLLLLLVDISDLESSSVSRGYSSGS
uniref:Uncharacterized protein n=1 Tax=Amphimedon queenslandica TaxID=400682 RepID=A0A1X7UJY8_AMPQE